MADNGAGMGPEACEHLFDRYYRGADTGQKAEGTGLGLAIAAKTIRRMGGTITARNTPTRGLEITITLPKEDSHAENSDC